jgi:hypothetical protein
MFVLQNINTTERENEDKLQLKNHMKRENRQVTECMTFLFV